MSSPATGTRSGKRSLVFSPPSVTKDKRPRGGDEASENGEDFDIDISELHMTILNRVNQAIGDCGKKQKAKSGKGGGSGGGGSGSEGDYLIQQLVPAIVTSVAMAVGEVLKSVVKRMNRPSDITQDPAVQHLQKNVLLMKYENDKLEQYSRRETIKVVGLTEEEDEDCEAKVLQVFKDVGAEVQARDISVTHRVGDKKRKKDRPILVRFTSRKTKKEIMMKKKTLKGKEGYKGVYVFEDLTNLRSRLLYYVKRIPDVEYAWTTEGTIHCVKKRPPGVGDDRPRKVFRIDNPDDLFSLGVDSVDFDDLGLSGLFSI